MKFFLQATPRRDRIPSAAVIDASLAWIKARLDDKTFDFCYGFIAGGGVAICNADSADAMLKLLMNYPGYSFSDFKVDPLCDIATALQEVKAMVQRVAAGA